MPVHVQIFRLHQRKNFEFPSLCLRSHEYIGAGKTLALQAGRDINSQAAVDSSSSDRSTVTNVSSPVKQALQK
ncbi:hypothetical protein Y887_17630 [Xanthomonas pisi DSM 18956]|nr:hypothetical protein Y887_17630 [Xanthomonas pisi DSM 18956]